jgi:hypothetical protein
MSALFKSSTFAFTVGMMVIQQVARKFGLEISDEMVLGGPAIYGVKEAGTHWASRKKADA